MGRKIKARGTKATKKPRKSAKLVGCLVGFEPTTFGTTIRRSNQLSYGHHVVSISRNRMQKYYFF